MIKSYEFTLLKICSHCGSPLPIGLARCQEHNCRKLRHEFKGHDAVVTDRHSRCIWKHEVTDVRLPDGRYLWAPYFLDAVRAGWLDDKYGFTEKYLAARNLRAGQKAKG